jgi:hypothetical protein
MTETGSTHHPQARARWHSRPQSSICKYPPSPPIFFCKDSFLLSHIGLLFGIPFAMRVTSQKCVKWLLVRKGTILFVSQTVSQETVCENLRFANCFARNSMRKSALRKIVRRYEQIAKCFASKKYAKVYASQICVFFDLLFYGDSTRGIRGRSQLQK